MKKNLVMIALLTLSFILALSASSLATDDNKGDIIIENINFEIKGSYPCVIVLSTRLLQILISIMVLLSVSVLLPHKRWYI